MRQRVVLASPSELSASPSELSASPSELLASPRAELCARPVGPQYEIYRVGYAAVCCGNLPPGNCPGRATPSSPESLLDYRCHAPGGKIGTHL